MLPLDLLHECHALPPPLGLEGQLTPQFYGEGSRRILGMLWEQQRSLEEILAILFLAISI